MAETEAAQGGIPALPANVREALEHFVGAARRNLGSDLVSAVLFGSAAEGRLRALSDVNLLLVLRAFDPAKIDPLRDPLRVARAAVRLGVMFLLESELSEAAEAFAVKFDDISRRSVVLIGENLVPRLAPSRGARVNRLRQVLLNLSIRLRERYAVASLREEQLAAAIADAAGPLRAAAATILDLRGRPAPSPKEAMAQLVELLDGGKPALVLASMSTIREGGVLPPGAANEAMLGLMALVGQMRAVAAELE
jgi:predicted nucleotidyltransferase